MIGEACTYRYFSTATAIPGKSDTEIILTIVGFSKHDILRLLLMDYKITVGKEERHWKCDLSSIPGMMVQCCLPNEQGAH